MSINESLINNNLNFIKFNLEYVESIETKISAVKSQIEKFDKLLAVSDRNAAYWLLWENNEYCKKWLERSLANIEISKEHISGAKEDIEEYEDEDAEEAHERMCYTAEKARRRAQKN